MLYGTIVKFFEDKNFGFIQSDTGRDIFFHISAVDMDDTPPKIRVGQAVKFELAPRGEAKPKSQPARGGERPSAKRVVLIDKVPGAIAEPESAQETKSHPKARKRKPTWRR